MLRTNHTLRKLHMNLSGIMWNAMVVEQGLSCNSSLEDLAVSLDPDGAHALMTLLQWPGGSITTSTATPASNASSTCPSQLKYLGLGTDKGRGFPTATALRDMLASNRTMLKLSMRYAPYSREEWATTILPALANNQSLTSLNLIRCPGVKGEFVYDAHLELLESNTCVQDIDLSLTPLFYEGKAAAVEEPLKANKEYRAALKDVPTTLTNSCRLVLCSSPYAGKSTLLDTMMQQHGHGKQRHGSPYYQHIVQKRASAKWLFKDDEKLKLSRRTRGIDILPLKIQDLTMWMWDFAGQTEFHCLHDFIFPNGTSVHAAGAFVFAFNPIVDSNESVGGGGLRLKKKQQFDQEFSYWLRFICSNSKPQPSRASKPSVFVVITCKDKFTSEKKRHEMRTMAKEWVRDMDTKFGHLINMEVDNMGVHNLFFVSATDKDDLELREFINHAVSSLRSRIGDVAKVPTICDAVATALGQGGSLEQQQLEPIISTDEFENLCKSEAEKLSLQHLFSSTTNADEVSTAMSKAVAAYLCDAGEVLYFAELPFTVRNPRWFAHGILGYLINIFSTHDDTGGADIIPGGYALWCCVKPDLEMPPMSNEDRFQNGVVSKASLSDLLKKALNKVGLNPEGVNTEQLIQFMEHLDLCFAIGDGSKYLLPAIFEDKDDKAAKGEQERSWKALDASSSTCIFVTRRLECSDPIRTFVTPGFFPRLQVVLHNKAGKWAKNYNINPDTCILEKNFCGLHFNGMEILVEHSGSSGYFVDIMVQSCQPRKETMVFWSRRSSSASADCVHRGNDVRV